MRTAHSARQNCNGTFQCRSINEPPQSPKSVVRRVRTGFAQLGVSRRGCGFVVCASRSLRGAKKHRTAALFCVSVASHLPARIPIAGLICAMGSVAMPASDRRISTSAIRVSRLAAVVWRQGKKVMVFLPSDCAPSLFLIPLAVPSFPRQPGSVGRSPGSICGLGIFVEFALVEVGSKLRRREETCRSFLKAGQMLLGGQKRLEKIVQRSE